MPTELGASCLYLPRSREHTFSEPVCRPTNAYALEPGQDGLSASFSICGVAGFALLHRELFRTVAAGHERDRTGLASSGLERGCRCRRGRWTGWLWLWRRAWWRGRCGASFLFLTLLVLRLFRTLAWAISFVALFNPHRIPAPKDTKV